MLKVKTVGIVDEVEFLVCAYDEGDREIIEEYIVDNGKRVYLGTGCGINLSEILSQVSRPIHNPADKQTVIDTIEKLNKILFPQNIEITPEQRLELISHARGILSILGEKE